MRQSHGISQPRVAVHLSCLVDCGYVTALRDGKKLRYSVGDPRVAGLLVLARSPAADNAVALDCCTRIPSADRVLAAHSALPGAWRCRVTNCSASAQGLCA
ncbi:helix-turn-helix domain-containing protein [Streptomyces sp. NPDC006251]|uniref:helix-turn-helix domain-containing protein n=1 Tax=Streptomyces sp. NPDC006251 TaxID=3155718 RepID=UPI0033B18341